MQECNPLAAAQHQPRPRRGATAVEFAIALPILFFCLFGFFELGHALMVDSVLENAAYEGARRGIVPGATSEAIVQAAESIGRISSLSDMTIIVEPQVITDETESVTVRAGTRLSNSGLVVGQYLLGRYIERSVTMRREPTLRNQFRPDVVNQNVPSTPKPRGRGKPRR